MPIKVISQLSLLKPSQVVSQPSQWSWCCSSCSALPPPNCWCAIDCSPVNMQPFEWPCLCTWLKDLCHKHPGHPPKWSHLSYHLLPCRTISRVVQLTAVQSPGCFGSHWILNRASPSSPELSHYCCCQTHPTVHLMLYFIMLWDKSQRYLNNINISILFI